MKKLESIGYQKVNEEDECMQLVKEGAVMDFLAIEGGKVQVYEKG